MLVTFCPLLSAVDLTDWGSVTGVAAVTGMYQAASGTDPEADTGRFTAPLQLEFSLHPNETHELFAKCAFAAGDGLSEVGTFTLTPWAVDHESDLKDINGRKRDHLLTAGYRFSRQFDEYAASLTVGIIDSTDFLGGNRFAEDEYTQFLNEAFVFNGSHGLPSYDYGGAGEMVFGDWSLTALAMDVGENGDGNEYLFGGVQLAHTHQTDWGRGTARLLVVGTSPEFLDPAGEKKERRFGGSISCDQELGGAVGAFVRLGWQRREALVTYGAFYSGGLSVAGSAWGRAADNLGIGYGYFAGGNADVAHTHVWELYYRWALFKDRFALTGDLQYLSDTKPNAPSPHGWLLGLRGVIEF